MESERREKRREREKGDLITANYPDGERFGDDWTFLPAIFHAGYMFFALYSNVQSHVLKYDQI